MAIAETARLMHGRRVKRLPVVNSPGEPVAVSFLEAMRQVNGVVAVNDKLSHPRR